MLITLVITADIEEISGQRSMHVTDIDAALDAVRHFLVRFAALQTGRHGADQAGPRTHEERAERDEDPSDP